MSFQNEDLGAIVWDISGPPNTQTAKKNQADCKKLVGHVATNAKRLAYERDFMRALFKALQKKSSNKQCTSSTRIFWFKSRILSLNMAVREKRVESTNWRISSPGSLQL